MYYVINTVSPLPIAQRLLLQKPTGLSISDLNGKPETKTQQSMINEGKINFEPSTSNVHETLRSLQLKKNFLRFSAENVFEVQFLKDGNHQKMPNDNAD